MDVLTSCLSPVKDENALTFSGRSGFSGIFFKNLLGAICIKTSSQKGVVRTP
jgi:hypothetical protein